MDSSCLVMAPSGFALLCKLVGESAEVTDVAAGSEGSADMPGDVVVGEPVDPEATVGPAGPGTGTVTTAAGVTTVGLSHALSASAIITAENTIEYFMRIPFDCLTKTGHLDRIAATRSCSSKVRRIRVRFRSLARLTPFPPSPVQPMEPSIPAQSTYLFLMCAAAQNSRKGRAIIFPYPPVLPLPEVDWRVEALGSCSCPRARFFVP